MYANRIWVLAEFERQEEEEGEGQQEKVEEKGRQKEKALTPFLLSLGRDRPGTEGEIGDFSKVALSLTLAL